MDDFRRERFEEQQADVMELEHFAASPFLFIMRFVEGSFILVFLGVFTLLSSIYLAIGGSAVLDRAKTARDLIADQSQVRTYSLDLTHPSNDDTGEGDGSYAPVCSTSGWDYDTQSDEGSKRQAATLAIAFQNANHHVSRDAPHVHHHEGRRDLRHQ
jgi:hypothetical protein